MKPQAGDLFVMVGTNKGGFLLVGDHARGFRVEGPLLPGWDLYHFTHDPRTGTLYAAAGSPFFGALVARSEDWGKTWAQDASGLAHQDGDEGKVTRVWNVLPSRVRPGRVWAGAEEAGLFRSDDGGKTFAPVAALRRHPTRAKWQPGGGGLCLHTIVEDPRDADRLYVGISAAGVYRTDDGGAHWKPINRGVRASFLEEEAPEVGQCVHKFALDPENPDTIYQQNHCGMYRSDDRGETWKELTSGLPSTFGFPLAAHPRRGGTAFLLPLEADTRRLPPGGELAVYRTRDRGESWEKCGAGLPKNAWVVVLREAMATDDGDPCGVYFGTHTGQVYASPDEGESWKRIADLLPPIRSVEVGRA